MQTYADTSFLQSHFINDIHTDRERLWIEIVSGSLFLSSLSVLEFENATLRRVGNEGFRLEHAERVIREFQEQIELGWFVKPVLDEKRIWKRALKLSSRYTAELKVRSLDIMHVAAAIESESKRFFTFDDRQNRLASAVGLEVIDRDAP